MKASLSWNAVLVLLWSVNNLLEMGGQVGMDSVFGKTGFFWGDVLTSIIHDCYEAGSNPT